LHGQFSSGCQNQNNWSFASLMMIRLLWFYLWDFLSMHMHNCGQQEGKSFPRSSLCNSDHVSSRQRYRPSLLLNGSRVYKVFAGLKCVQDVLGELRLFECLDWSRHMCSSDCDSVVSSPFLDVILASLLAIFMFLQMLDYL
jgi:hypothetical protein